MPACKNDYEEMLKVFKNSNFESNPKVQIDPKTEVGGSVQEDINQDPHHYAIVSINENKVQFAKRMDKFYKRYKQNKIDKRTTRAFIWISSHGLIFQQSKLQYTNIVHTTPHQYTDFETWIRKIGSFAYINVYVGFDCCRVQPKWADEKEMNAFKGVEEDDDDAG